MPRRENYGLFFCHPDAREDERQVALVAAMSEKRMDRAVGVKYNKDPQKEVCVIMNPLIIIVALHFRLKVTTEM